MKRTYAVLMCLFWSVMILAQTEGRNQSVELPPKEDCGSVDVWIDRVIWNANDAMLGDEIADEKQNFSIPGASEHSLGTFSHPTFHIAVLRFKKRYNFNSDDTFRFDASARLAQGEKPVYFVFGHYNNDPINVEIMDDYTVRFMKNMDSGEVLKAGGGVITTVGIMGRGMGKVGSLSSGRCVVLELTERITNETCFLPDRREDACAVITPETKVETGDVAFIHSYPNPVQDRLFVETNGLDIQATNILNLQGQSINHQVQVSYAEDRLQIDTNRLESGLYILQLETTSGRVSKKIYVQR